MSNYRYTVEILASGQPRPYADSRLHVRLTIESFVAWLGSNTDPRSHWQPNETWKEDQVRALLPHLQCGFPKKPATEWHHTQLDWLKNTGPGVWEFHTTTPFTG